RRVSAKALQGAKTCCSTHDKKGDLKLCHNCASLALGVGGWQASESVLESSDSRALKNNGRYPLLLMLDFRFSPPQLFVTQRRAPRHPLTPFAIGASDQPIW